MKNLFRSAVGAEDSARFVFLEKPKPREVKVKEEKPSPKEHIPQKVSKKEVKERSTKIQQDLMFAGYDLPKHGADGTLGTEVGEAVIQMKKNWNKYVDLKGMNPEDKFQGKITGILTKKAMIVLNEHVVEQKKFFEENVKSAREFVEGLAIVKKGGQEFHINKEGKPLYSERYDSTSLFNKGLAKASKDGQAFHINKEGKPAYSERYDSVGSFREGLATASKDGRAFHINTKGKPAYSERYDDSGYFNKGLATATKDGQAFHINTKGKPAYSERYDFVHGFSKGLAMADKDGQWFQINKEGKPAYSERYDSLLKLLNERDIH